MKGLIEFISAILISAPLYTAGLIVNIVEIFKVNKNLKGVVEFLKQLYYIFHFLFEKLAVVLDLLGNVISGRLFYLILVDTSKIEYEQTYFGKGKFTISYAIGHVEQFNYLTKRGLKFSKFLSWTLREKEHCQNAYFRKEYLKFYKEI